MAWTTPNTVAAGDALTASMYNTYVRDNLNALGSAVFNVQSAAKTDTFTMASTTFADVTGLSVAITPSAATSKVLVHVSMMMGAVSGVTNVFARLVRGATTIAVGDVAGSRIPITVFGAASAANPMGGMVFLDSPGTTSATTYKIQIRAQSANSIFINKDNVDTDSSAGYRGISTITVIEVPVS